MDDFNLRPKTWDELMGLDRSVIGTKTQKEFLRTLAKRGNVRSLLFYGPPGTGKTSAARLFAMDYLEVPYEEIARSAIRPGSGCPHYRELNASDERKLEDLRFLVDNFILKPSPKGRVVVFDEADGFPWQTQDFLRATIERYSDRCIFIFCLNNIDRMHDAILSRAVTFRFDPIPPKLVKEWLLKKAKEFNIEITPEAAYSVVSHYNGDMRSIVNKFLKVYEGEKVTKFEPAATFAEEIFMAKNKAKKYEEIVSENSIDHQQLIYRLFILNGKKKAPVFFRAAEMLKGLNGVHPEIAMYYLFEEAFK